MKDHTNSATGHAHGLPGSSEFRYSLHRRTETKTDFRGNARREAATRGGQSGALQFSMSFPYPQRMQIFTSENEAPPHMRNAHESKQRRPQEFGFMQPENHSRTCARITIS